MYVLLKGMAAQLSPILVLTYTYLFYSVYGYLSSVNQLLIIMGWWYALDYRAFHRIYLSMLFNRNISKRDPKFSPLIKYRTVERHDTVFKCQVDTLFKPFGTRSGPKKCRA